VNLIGEHTDYNDGFCLPMAIEHDVRIAWAPSPDGRFHVTSTGQGGEVLSFPAEGFGKDPVASWTDYLKGCIRILADEGSRIVPCRFAVHGDVPMGSGLSSSAAIEVATIHALLAASGETVPASRIAELAQRAENEFVGTRCGILDQLASSCAREGRVMLMDCRSLGLHHAPMPPGAVVVVADTGKRRGLVDSAYNRRREQCELGARAIGVSHLRDASLADCWRAREDGSIDEETWRRCVHVVAENGRTRAAAACLGAGDLAAFGALMDQSHADLRDRFEVSCPELDDLVALARALPGCLGSRMTGAGFGGCTVNLVEEAAAEGFCAALSAAYRDRHPDLPFAVHRTRPAAGAAPLDPSPAIG